jgi:hypothetical protein
MQNNGHLMILYNAKRNATIQKLDLVFEATASVEQ